MNQTQHELTGRIIGCAMQVHSKLGAGFVESVYRRALTHELRKAALNVDCERPIAVEYDRVNVGTYVADIVVEDLVILELKATLALLPLNEVQLVNYLTATGLDIGLLINFGGERLEFKRKHRLYRPPGSPRT